MNNPHKLTLLTGVMVLTLTACSTLPVRQAVEPSYAHQVETQQTSLSQLLAKQRKQSPDLTGYHVLFDPTHALLVRLELIERAEKAIDLQYYIWDNDKVGMLAVAGLMRAAERGVKVRLLIDDNNAKKMQDVYIALNQHPNIEVRLFNPYRFRHFRLLDILLDSKRITRRMHNKTFIVDYQVGLIGGRNMSDQYYNVGENYQFSDMDVALVGKAVYDIRDSFDEYWNHDYAYSVAQFSKKTPKMDYTQLKRKTTKVWEESQIAQSLKSLDRKTFSRWLNQDLKLEWVDAKIVTDPADKIANTAPTQTYLAYRLKDILNVPTKQIDLVSAYFVPQERDLGLLNTLKQQGIQARILTNSFKANDVPIVHAFYAKKRKAILQQGAELYEFLPVLPLSLTHKQRIKLFGEQKFNREGLGRSSLHGKFLALDYKQVFIGSYNFDPRSTYLNSEIGVVLNSPKLAKAVHQSMEKGLLNYAYKVELDDQQRLIWKQKTEDGMLIHHTEPQMKWWQRMALKFVSILPIEKQM